MASPVVLRSNSNNIVASPNTSSSLRRSSTIVSNSHLDANDLITISSSHHHHNHHHMNGNSNSNNNGGSRQTNDKSATSANYNNINSEIYLNSSKDISMLSLNGDILPYSNTLHTVNDSFYLHRTASSNRDKADTSIRSDNIDDLEDGDADATLARIASGSSSASSNHSNHSMMSNVDSIETTTTITKRQSILVRQNSARPKKRVSFNENLLEVHLIPTKSIEIDSYEEFNNYERSYTSTVDTRYTTSYTNPPLLATKKLLNSKFYKPIRTLKTIESNAQITSDLRKNSRQGRVTSYGSLSRSNSIANGNSRVSSTDVGTNDNGNNTVNGSNNLYKLSIKSIEFSNPINQLTTSPTHKTAITIEPLSARKNSANNEHNNHLYASSSTTNGSQIYNHGFVPNSLFSRFINHTPNNDTESISSNSSSNYVSTSSIKENISTDAAVPQIKYVPNMKKLRKTLNGTEIKEVWKEINKEKQQRDYENNMNNFSNNNDDSLNSYDGESTMLNNSLLLNTSSNYDYDKNKMTTKYEIKPNNSLYSSLNRSPSIASTTATNPCENTIPKSSTKSIYMNKINQLIALRNANVLNTTNSTIRKSSHDNTTNPSQTQQQQSTIKSRINTNTLPLSSSDLRRTHSALPILLRSSNNRINSYNTTKLLNSNPTISSSSPRATSNASSTHVQHFSSIKRSPAIRYTQSKVS